MQKYALWLVPENELYQELETVILNLSTKYEAPTFVPHMTIHNPVESTDERVVAAVQTAVKTMQPFDVPLGPVECSTTYFQCVFVRLQTTTPLLEAHLALKSALGVETEHVFMPHSSLVYGNFDMQTRERIAHDTQLVNTRYTASKITIVRADSVDPKDWAVVEQIGIS